MDKPDVFRIKENEKPTSGETKALIRIYAATISAGECEQRGLKLPFWEIGSILVAFLAAFHIIST